MITGKIPFNEHLYNVGACDVDEPYCACGPSNKKIYHIFFNCLLPRRVRLRQKLLTRLDDSEITDIRELCREFAKQAATYLALVTQSKVYREVRNRFR